jgi:hypothetical protein
MSPETGADPAVVRWLLAGDPAIRWQTMRDLRRRPRAEWVAEQGRVATEGWGARLLSFQDAAGRWTPRFYGHKWISTTYSMTLLWRMGLPSGDEHAIRSCVLFLEEGQREDGGINPAVSLDRSEECVSGLVLALLSWFGLNDPRRERIVEFLLRRQMADGGWNCEWDRGATHASLHTTISALEGLREYAAASGARSAETTAAERRGRDFLLEHGLFRSHRTGEVIDPRMLRLSFPPRWRYDVLRCLDYLRAAGASPDERMEEAVQVVRAKRRKDGRWPLQQRYPGRTWFEMERVGEPSRWNTLRAQRVLDWWTA